VDETQVGINLYSALTQFFTVYSEYLDSDFYVTGEVSQSVYKGLNYSRVW
jgi:hypothetical protein